MINKIIYFIWLGGETMITETVKKHEEIKNYMLSKLK